MTLICLLNGRIILTDKFTKENVLKRKRMVGLITIFQDVLTPPLKNLLTKNNARTTISFAIEWMDASNC